MKKIEIRRALLIRIVLLLLFVAVPSFVLWLEASKFAVILSAQNSDNKLLILFYDFYHLFVAGLAFINLVLFFMLAAMYYSFRKFLYKLYSVMETLSIGKTKTSIGYFEARDPRLHKYLKIQLKKLRVYTSFTNKLRKDEVVKKLDTDEFSDSLGKNLQKIRQNLIEAKQEKIERQLDDEQRNWSIKGQAVFTDILHKNKGSIEDLAENILTKLIAYTKSNQGSFYLFDEAQNALDVVFTYAWERKKFDTKQIVVGEGLVGACAYERQSIFLTEVPHDYIRITSGMGDAAPKCILIFPLMVETTLIGVIEIASFHVFSDVYIEFCEKIGENIAITIHNLQISAQTKTLLEETQYQKTELSEQDEELRQNMEELQTTQEEMERKQEELIENQNLLNTIIDMIPFPIFVKNINRTYLLANQEQGNLFNMRAEEIIGHKDEDFINDFTEINAIWESDSRVLKNEKMVLPEQILTFPDGRKRILQTIKVPFINNKTKNINILGISVDLSDKRRLEIKQEKYKQEIEALKKLIEGQNIEIGE